MGFLSPAEWSGATSKVDAGTGLPMNTFQAQAAGLGNGPTDLSEQDFNQMISNALAQQAGVNTNQNALAQSLQAQANGTGGPNLAQQQLQNATNQNIQSQAGAVAGLRGLNPAMAGRLIANQGAAIQQGAAGQSAELRMQQQLAAQQQLAGLYAQQAGQNSAYLNAGLGGQTAQNSLNLQNFGQQQAINANKASQNASLQSAAQAQNAGLAGYQAQAAGATASGLGSVFASQAGRDGAAAAGGAGAAASSTGLGAADLEAAGTVALAAHGGEVPGRRPYPGDDTRNDTKPFMLSPGEKVIPASIADDPQAVAAFVAAIERHKKKHGKGK
jgi:hypothetical protein